MTEPGLSQLCVLRVGAEEYVVDLSRVDEILPIPEVTPVPRAPGFVEGVVKLRGEVVPVVDVRKRLGVLPGQGQVLTPSGKPRNRERLLVCRIGRRRVGFLVDAVTHVLKVPRASLRPAPLASGPGRQPHVLGVCGEAGQLKLLLDVKALVAGEGE
ncbi:MAG: purine-binding chemotaxis protein CheW [Myxococcales bacterium]|nr:purine-binding chemotaxis protein CheW [Myxococcales bacterium]